MDTPQDQNNQTPPPITDDMTIIEQHPQAAPPQPAVPTQPQPPAGIQPQPPTAATPLPKATVSDLIYALFLLVLGFCFWDWSALTMVQAGFGTTVLFLSVLVASFIYLRVKGVKQNAASLIMLVVAFVGALPFAINGPRDINPLLVACEIVFCLLWIMYSCRSALASKLSAVMAGDLFSQLLVVPFANFSRFFTRPLQLLNKSGKTWVSILFALLGLVICVPVFALVIWLLTSADNGFSSFMDGFTRFFQSFNAGQYLFHLVLGIPVAAYIFGVVFGNVYKRHTNHFSEAGWTKGFNSAHTLPRAMMYLPMVLLALLYVVFIITMANYLFSGLQGNLPVTYTYAEYARQGFFQLCAVATINLVILLMVWLLAKRAPGQYPLALRLLSGLLTLLTCLLIITAMSKMILYIQIYSLTPLRLYVSWFMLFMLLGFALLVAWHIKPFNAAKPIIVLGIIFVLVGGLANTNAVIANYNVDRYLSGNAKQVDITLLEDLGDPAVPALYKLKQSTHNQPMINQAAAAISLNHSNHQNQALNYDNGLTTWGGWPTQNAQFLITNWLYTSN